jgi:hypothetical protein
LVTAQLVAVAVGGVPVLVGGGGVFVAPPEVVMLTHQPPEIMPASPPRSSTTYRLQLPLAGVPSNTDRAVP